MTEKQMQETQLEPQLVNDLRRLSDTGMEPPRDLWPRLKSELRRDASSKRSHVGSYALAAALLLSVSVGVVWMQLRAPSERDSLAIDSRTILAMHDSTSEELRATQARYVSERAETLRAIAGALEDYPAALREEIRRSIEEIERAMVEIERSIERSQVERGRELRLAELYELELSLLAIVRDRLAGVTLIGGAS